MHVNKAKLMAVLALMGGLEQPPYQDLTAKERDKQPRKFTDARIAAAQAKRERKAAKRRRQESGNG